MLSYAPLMDPAPNPVDVLLWDVVAQEETGRRRRFARAWDAYRGLHPPTLRSRVGQADDNLTINACKIVVDAGVSFLFGKGVDFQADNDPKRSNEEAHIDAVWAASRKMTLLHELAINGAIHGSAFLKIQPRPDSKIPRLIALDPAIVTPSWDSDDVHRAWRYRLQWTELERRVARPDVLVRRQVIERDDGGRWSIADYVSRRGGRWEPMGKTIPWNYAWPPIADCQNLPCPNAYWGEADLGDDVLGLNDGLNFSQSNMQRIERYHGHPRLYGYGLQPAPPSPDGEDAGGAADAAIDGIIEFGSQDAFIRAVDAISSLSSHLERYRSLKEALHEIARVPQIATGKLDSIGQLSGLALKILYGPLLAKTATKRILYGDLLAEINARLLELANMDGSLPVANVWPEVLPSDPLTEANAAKIEMELGILSRETAAAQVGLDWDQERARIEQERGAQLEAIRAAQIAARQDTLPAGVEQ